MQKKWEKLLTEKNIPSERWEECSAKLDRAEQKYRDNPENFKKWSNVYLSSISPYEIFNKNKH